ncbi:MAG: hypothetical protein QF473_02130 [Planctomycetota bacterium]|nr:hypothetical protein [Planctomycetota bacterium]
MALSPAGTINNVISMNGLGASADRSANQSQGTGQGANAFAGSAVANAQAQNAALFQIPTAGNATSAGIGTASAGTNLVAGSPAGSSVGRPVPTMLTIPALQIPGITLPATSAPPTETAPTFAAFPPPTGPGFAPVVPGIVFPQPSLNSAQQLVAPQTSLLSVPTLTLEPAPPEEEEEELPALQPLPTLNLSNAATELPNLSLSNAATGQPLALPALLGLPAFNLSPTSTLSLADVPVIGLPTPLLDTNTDAANLDTDTDAANLDIDTDAADLVDDAIETTEEASVEEAETEEVVDEDHPDPFGLNNAAANFAVTPIRFLDNRVLSPTENGGDTSNSGSQTASNQESTSVGNLFDVTA